MRCTHYDHPRHGERIPPRCEAEATRKLVAPDGEPTPGGGMCETHARRILEEYQAKLDPRWTWYRIDELGRRMDEPGSFAAEIAEADAAGMLAFWDDEDGAEEVSP